MHRIGLPLALALALGLFTAGCASHLQAVSSAPVGCPPNEIAISDSHAGLSAKTWQATCRGAVFQCSAFNTGPSTTQVNCSPTQAMPAPAAPSAIPAPPAPPPAAAAPALPPAAVTPAPGPPPPGR